MSTPLKTLNEINAIAKDLSKYAREKHGLEISKESFKDLLMTENGHCKTDAEYAQLYAISKINSGSSPGNSPIDHVTDWMRTNLSKALDPDCEPRQRLDEACYDFILRTSGKTFYSVVEYFEDVVETMEIFLSFLPVDEALKKTVAEVYSPNSPDLPHIMELYWEKAIRQVVLGYFMSLQMNLTRKGKTGKLRQHLEQSGNSPIYLKDSALYNELLLEPLSSVSWFTPP
ncbi:hypothetical protein ACI2KR_26910 [Pseudomonas luteola]